MTATVALSDLRAVTREVDPPADVLAAFGEDGTAWLHDGAEFVTAGVAARVAAQDAVVALAAIEHDADPALPGAGPRAIGALHFDPNEPAELVVPSRIVGRTSDGRGWVTEVGTPARSNPSTADEPTRFSVAALCSREEWSAAIAEVLAAIDGGEVDKVVLARAVEVEGDRPFDPQLLLARLRLQQPGCFVYGADGMFGATPELLVARFGRHVVSRPMAGTAPAGSGALDALRGSAKDAWEHRIVVDAIVSTLHRSCTEVDAAAAPEVDEFADVAHLATPIHGTLADPAPDALAMARALHPTPAVGGAPTDGALELIARLEGAERGRYAGPVGWVDARGDGEWAVALRGASIDGARARLHAGAGIVAGSDPEQEWRETEAKLDPMLRALVRP
ncbi:MAG: isochorismate synthase [Actinobacteria bacterium]|nr:isochorismate synthase [Actinomycetota bacterium]